MRKKNNMKKWLLIIAVFVVIFTVSIFVIMSGNKVKYEGSGKSGLWFSNIEKSDKNSIGPNYFLHLYWQGSKKDEKRTVVSKITLYIDGKSMMTGKIMIYQSIQVKKCQREVKCQTTSLPLTLCLKRK